MSATYASVVKSPASVGKSRNFPVHRPSTSYVLNQPQNCVAMKTRVKRQSINSKTLLTKLSGATWISSKSCRPNNYTPTPAGLIHPNRAQNVPILRQNKCFVDKIVSRTFINNQAKMIHPSKFHHLRLGHFPLVDSHRYLSQLSGAGPKKGDANFKVDLTDLEFQNIVGSFSETLPVDSPKRDGYKMIIRQRLGLLKPSCVLNFTTRAYYPGVRNGNLFRAKLSCSHCQLKYVVTLSKKSCQLSVFITMPKVQKDAVHSGTFITRSDGSSSGDDFITVPNAVIKKKKLNRRSVTRSENVRLPNKEPVHTTSVINISANQTDQSPSRLLNNYIQIPPFGSVNNTSAYTSTDVTSATCSKAQCRSVPFFTSVRPTASPNYTAFNNPPDTTKHETKPQSNLFTANLKSKLYCNTDKVNFRKIPTTHLSSKSTVSKAKTIKEKISSRKALSNLDATTNNATLPNHNNHFHSQSAIVLNSSNIGADTQGLPCSAPLPTFTLLHPSITLNKEIQHLINANIAQTRGPGKPIFIPNQNSGKTKLIKINQNHNSAKTSESGSSLDQNQQNSESCNIMTAEELASLNVLNEGKGTFFLA